jgi:hypothetical protein
LFFQSGFISGKEAETAKNIFLPAEVLAGLLSELLYLLQISQVNIS